MGVEKIETYKYTCDVKNCGKFQVSKSGRPSGWGLVRVYDNKHDPTCIGDQNGWNNFEMCVEHYTNFMISLGVEAHNIPEVPDDEG